MSIEEALSILKEELPGYEIQVVPPNKNRLDTVDFKVLVDKKVIYTVFYQFGFWYVMYENSNTPEENGRRNLYDLLKAIKRKEIH